MPERLLAGRSFSEGRSEGLTGEVKDEVEIRRPKGGGQQLGKVSRVAESLAG